MVTTDPTRKVDDSPIVVSEIVVDGQRLVAREPLQFEVERVVDEGEALFVLYGDFDISCWADTREELVEILGETLETYWTEFAQADPEELSPKANALRLQLLERMAVPSDGA